MEKKETKEENKLNIIYEIKGIGPYDRVKDWVSVLLVPMDPLDIPTNKKKGNIMVQGFSPMGGAVPPEAIEEMQEVISKMFNIPKQDEEAERDIVIIEKDTDFQKRGWKYGDQISVTFEKLII